MIDCRKYTGKCKICGKNARNWYPMEKGQPYFCDKHDPYPIETATEIDCSKMYDEKEINKWYGD